MDTIPRYKWAALVGFSGKEGEEEEEKETMKLGKGNWNGLQGPLKDGNGKMDIIKMHCIHIENFQKKQKKIETAKHRLTLGFNMDKIKLKVVLSVKTMI